MEITVMGEINLETGVDQLIKLLSKQQRMSLQDASKTLGVDEESLQTWVDFLVEEKILGIEYKFTKPFIYLEKTQKAENLLDNDLSDNISLETFKERFLEKNKDLKISKDKSSTLWEEHLMEQIDANKEFFEKEAKKRNLNGVEELWQHYKERVLSL